MFVVLPTLLTLHWESPPYCLYRHGGGTVIPRKRNAISYAQRTPLCQEIAGQARNDGKGLNVVLPFCVSSQVIRRNSKKVTRFTQKKRKNSICARR